MNLSEKTKNIFLEKWSILGYADTLTLIHWITIYPVDSAIQPSNNWGLLEINM